MFVLQACTASWKRNTIRKFKTILNHAMLTVPDGMPTVWVGKLQGFRSMKRVFGPDLMTEVCARSVEKGYKHFLYGGAPGVAEQLKCRLLSKFPGICIVGTHTPPVPSIDRGRVRATGGDDR